MVQESSVGAISGGAGSAARFDSLGAGDVTVGAGHAQLDAHALVIGVSRYQHIRPLPEVQDAPDVAMALTDVALAGYPPANVCALLDATATRTAILAELDKLEKRTTTDSTVVVYFSGHGGRIERDGREVCYLLPVDTESGDALERTAISGDELSARLRALPAARVTVILDCCRASGIAEPKDIDALSSELTPRALAPLAQGRGRAVLAASRSDGIAYVVPGQRNGVFTRHLLDGLRGAAEGAGGVIRIFDLYHYVQQRVISEIGVQRTVFKSELEDNYPIALYRGGAAPASPLAPAPDALTYDAFVSYDRSEARDCVWVEQVVVPRLEARGLRLCLEHRDFRFGRPRIREMERAVIASRYTISILTPAYLASSFREFESLIAQHQDLETRAVRFLPLLRRPCQPHIGVRMVFALDLTRDTEVEAGIERLAIQLRQLPASGDGSDTAAPAGTSPVEPASITGREELIPVRDEAKSLIHICYAPADHEWVHGRMLCELGLQFGQYRTREDDRLDELQFEAISRAVEESRFTVLIASSAARWNQLTQFAAALAQHAGLEQRALRLVIIARDFQPDTEAAKLRLSLGQRVLVSLDCSDNSRTTESLTRLRKELELAEPIDERPPCPYPGLTRFTAANRHLLFGRDGDRQRLIERIRAGHSRILVVGPSGSGKSSLIHAAVLPELTPQGHIVRVVPRSDHLADSLRQVADELDVPDLGTALDSYQAAVVDATDATIDQARNALCALPVPDERRRIIVIDPLEEIFVEDDAEARVRLFTLLGGLWSLPWCTVVLCMRADFYGALMVERCWRELEDAQYTVAPLDEPGLRAAIVEPALRAGVHVDAALVERLTRETDRDRSSVPLPILQVALVQLWDRLSWRYLSLTDYERFVDRDQRGLAVVLGTHATAVVQALASPGDNVVAQRVLLDLVHLGEGRPDTRRRRSLDELRRAGDVAGQLERVVDRLIEGRLVTAADGQEGELRAASTASKTTTGCIRYIDLSHDTLITGWPRLAGWIAERREDLRTQRRLEARAEFPGRLGSDELPEFLRWVRSATASGQALGVSPALRALVRRSVRARRIRQAAVALAAFAVLAVALGFRLQVQQLHEEQAKTAIAIDEAMDPAREIVHEINEKLSVVPGAGPAAVRATLLDKAGQLIAKLERLHPLGNTHRRLDAVRKSEQADMAFQQARFVEAQTLYLEVLADMEKPGTPASQLDLSISYNKLGDVALAMGKPADARDWFAKGLAIATTVAADAPHDTGWQRELSVSYNKLGDAALSERKPDEARTWFERGRAVRENLTRGDPSNTGFQRDLSASYHRLGGVAMLEGKLDDARGWFDKCLGVAKQLARVDPSNTGFQHDLAASYGKLGEVALAAHELDEAGRSIEQSLAIYKRLAESDPGNTGFQRELALSYGQLGAVAQAAHKLDDASRSFEQAIDVVTKLVSVAPSNTGWRHDLSQLLVEAGGVAAAAVEQGVAAAAAGKHDEAHRWFEQALEIARTLASRDPSNQAWRHYLWAAIFNLGKLALSSRSFDEARSWLEQAVTVARTPGALDPGNTAWQRELATVYEVLGQLAKSANRLDEARSWLEQGLAVVKTLGADPSDTTSRRDLLVFYHHLAELADRANSLDDARTWSEQGLAVTRALLEAEPHNAELQHELSWFCRELGYVATAAGKLDDARIWLEQGLAVDITLVAAEPHRTEWKRGLALSYEFLGKAAVVAGDLDVARGWFAKEIPVRRALAAAHATDQSFQLELCWALVVAIPAARGPAEVARYRDEARAIYERLQRAEAFRGDAEFAQLGESLDALAAGSEVPSIK